MTRYRLGDVVTEWEADGLWVAPLPDGPIGRIEGVGPVIVDALEGAGSLTAKEILKVLRAELTGVPAEADELVAEFLRGLARQGVVHMIDA